MSFPTLIKNEICDRCNCFTINCENAIIYCMRLNITLYLSTERIVQRLLEMITPKKHEQEKETTFAEIENIVYSNNKWRIYGVSQNHQIFFRSQPKSIVLTIDYLKIMNSSNLSMRKNRFRTSHEMSSGQNTW